jgi:hypothetical protein
VDRVAAADRLNIAKKNITKEEYCQKETLSKRNLQALRRREEYSPTPRPHDLCIAAIISWLHRSLLVQAWARPGAGHGLEPQAPTCCSPCLPPAKFTAPTPPNLQRLQDEWQLLQLLKRKASSKGAWLLSSKRQRFPVHKTSHARVRGTTSWRPGRRNQGTTIPLMPSGGEPSSDPLKEHLNLRTSGALQRRPRGLQANAAP